MSVPYRYRHTVLCLTLVLAAGAASAGSPDAPEVTDPEGDAIHLEFRNPEPQLDVTGVWFAWEDDRLMVHIAAPHHDQPGPDGTADGLDDATYFDVYWTFEEAEYVARAWFDGDGTPHYQAGQAMRIERVLAWEPDADIHGALLEQAGEMPNGTEGAEGAEAAIVITVDPADVGAPGPGDTLADPSFSTYVDHHPPAEMHHPGHVDAADESGTAFTIPATETGDDAAATGGADVESPGAALLLLLVGTLILAVRRRH